MVLRLREVRKGLGLTLEGAAERVDMDTGSVSRHEREEGTDLDHLKMYAEAYRCHIAEFFIGGRVLTDPEDQLIGLFRKLSGPQQEAIISMMMTMGDDTSEGEERAVNGANPSGPIRKVSAKVG